MITITVFERHGEVAGFDCSGHAEYDDPGKDIVCASVSVLTINTVNSLEMITRDDVEASEVSGHLICNFRSQLSEGGRVLVDSMLLGISQIQKQYPSYIRMKRREV
ncbi:MAG: ribosomal-processing cysteine protease Prp [Lachnospiraceae bacterium]|nr:ribosomal-processing cysteine protease Prp [Lachnospiraceae bacterium]